MFTVTVETTIDRPVEEVFEFLADAENDIRWCPSVQEIERIEGDNPGEGARYEMVHEPGGMTFEAIVETTTYRPHDRLEWLMTDSGHRLEITYEFDSANNGNGTYLKQTSEVQPRGWLYIPGWLMQSKIKEDMKDEMNGQFENLKALLESGEE